MTAPTREERLISAYRGAAELEWSDTFTITDSVRAGVVATVLASLDMAGEPSEADEPRVGDDESLRWCLERWDSWALSLVGYDGRTIESVGRVDLRASIKGLVQMGQAEHEPSAPAEPATAKAFADAMVQAEGMRNGAIVGCIDGVAVVRVDGSTTAADALLIAAGRAIAGACDDDLCTCDHDADGSDPGCPEHGTSPSVPAEPETGCTDSAMWAYVNAAAPEPGPTIAADRVQDIAEAHAEVEGLKRKLDEILEQRDGFGDEATRLRRKLARSEELRAQAEAQCERRTAEVETYREQAMAHRDEAAGLHFAAAEFRSASRARIATLKAQSLADNAAVRSTYHHVVKCAGRGDQSVGEQLATLQDVCKMTGVLAGEMAYERKALEVALDIERGVPAPTVETLVKEAYEGQGAAHPFFGCTVDATGCTPLNPPSSTLGPGSTHPRSGVTRLHGEPEEGPQERPDKATARHLVALLTGSDLDTLAAEFGIDRAVVYLRGVVIEREADVGVRNRTMLAIEASG